MLSTILFLNLVFSPSSDAAGQQLVITKDVTVTENQNYDTVVVISGNVDFFGSTSKLYVVNGEVKLEKGSEVRDQIWIISGQIFQNDGARVPESGIQKVGTDTGRSFVESFQDRNWFEWLTLPFVFAFKLLFYFLCILIGFLVLALAPGLSIAADRSLQEKPWQSFFSGLSAMLMLIPATVILAISIVGIPLIPLLGFLFLVFLAAGIISVGRALGLSFLPSSYRNWATFIGLIIMFLLVSLPYVGGFTFFLLMTTGLGAIFRSMFNRSSRLPPDDKVIDAESYAV